MTHLRSIAVLLVQGSLVSFLGAQAPFNASLLPPEAETVTRAGGPFAAALERARGSVVHIAVLVNGSFRIERPGTGVVIGEDLVVTWWSLVSETANAGERRILVKLRDEAGTELFAEVIARDERYGLALLRVKRMPGRDQAAVLTPIALALDVQPGDPAIVSAFGDGEDAVAFAGVVSAAAGGVTAGGDRDPVELTRDEILLTDAAIQRRCHGAALLSPAGELIGLCNAEQARETQAEPTLEDLKRPSFGYVVPSRTILAAFTKDLKGVRTERRTSPSPQAAAVARIAESIVAVRGGSGTRSAIGLLDPYAKQRRAGVGSGVVVEASGLVLTNRHLVADAETITITTHDGGEYTAELLMSDRGTNAALLRVRLPAGKSLKAVPWASSGSVAPGDPVLTIGSPEAGALLLGSGVVSAMRGGHVQFDAPAGNQNGGGALITPRGELIGIVDGGAIDKLDLAFAQRGDQAKVETSLNLAPGTDRLADVFREKLTVRGDPASPSGAHVAAVVDRVGIAMLNVYVEITSAAADVEDNPFATSAPRTMTEGLGSGVVVDPSGLALTNWHVVDSATFPDGSTRPDRVVRVGRRDGRVFDVRILSISREEDLALLQLELEPGERIPAVELGSSASLEVGDSTIAIGNPHGRANTVTAGVITARNQSIRVKGRWAKLPHLIETDAAINAGNSGGALLDHDGRLIGINSAGGSSFAVTGYAIAVDHVREKLHSVLLSPEKLRSPYAGLTVADREGKVVVHSVDPTGPAAAAGIATGEVVVSVSGVTVRWSIDWATTLLGAPTTVPAQLVVERDGVRADKTLDLLTAPQWAVCRQSGLVTRTMSFREDEALVRDVAIAFFRAFTGDPEAQPTRLPESLVRVERVVPRGGDLDSDLQPGDFVLGVQIDAEHVSGESGHLERFERVEEVQAAIDAHGSYEGTTFQLWVARDRTVRKIEFTAKRLIL